MKSHGFPRTMIYKWLIFHIYFGSQESNIHICLLVWRLKGDLKEYQINGEVTLAHQHLWWCHDEVFKCYSPWWIGKHGNCWMRNSGIAEFVWRYGLLKISLDAQWATNTTYDIITSGSIMWENVCLLRLYNPINNSKVENKLGTRWFNAI